MRAFKDITKYPRVLVDVMQALALAAIMKGLFKARGRCVWFLFELHAGGLR